MFANRSESSACREPVVVIAPRPPSRARTTPLVSLPAMSSPRKTAHERLNTAPPRKKRKRRATLHAKRPSEPVTTPRHLPRRDTYPCLSRRRNAASLAGGTRTHRVRFLPHLLRTVIER